MVQTLHLDTDIETDMFFKTLFYIKGSTKRIFPPETQNIFSYLHYNFCRRQYNYVRKKKRGSSAIMELFRSKTYKNRWFPTISPWDARSLEKPLKGQELPMSRGRVIRVQSVQTTTGGGGGVMLTRGIPPSRKCKTWLLLPPAHHTPAQLTKSTGPPLFTLPPCSSCPSYRRKLLLLEINKTPFIATVSPELDISVYKFQKA